MIRVLGVELRRSVAIGTAAGVAVVGALALYVVEGIGFSAGWMQLAMTQRLYLALLWPLVLAAGAFQARREQHANVGELFATTPRPVPQRVAPTLAGLAVAVVGGYLLMGLAGAVWIVGTAGYFPVEVVAVTAVGALALVAAAWLGLAVGRLLPSPVTAPALGVAGLGLLLVLPLATRPHEWLGLVFSPIAEMNLPGDYATVPSQVSAAQGLWLAGLAVTAALLVASSGWRTRVAAVLPVAAGLALAVTVVPHQNDLVQDAVDPVARELVCAEGEPQVCVSRVHERRLPEVTGPAREALALLAGLPDAPSRVHEDTSAYPGTYPDFDADTVLLPVDADRGGHLANDATVVADVVIGAFDAPRTCLDVPARVDQLAAAHWLMGTAPVVQEREATNLPPPDPSAEADAEVAEASAVWEQLRALPEDEARARVAALREAAVTCQPSPGVLR